ncbi:MAG: hypothetical protein IJ994_00205, partial [Firmicutes bacterium]|nr:hypothetical protein [Bacillota bacterium]
MSRDLLHDLHSVGESGQRAAHKEYLNLLRKIKEIDGVKKVFIRSGIRFDYLIYDKCDDFF